MNKDYKRTTQYNKKLADLHDMLELHMPIHHQVFDVCKKCGAPIVSLKNDEYGAYLQIDSDVEALKHVVLNTRVYNKYILQRLTVTPYGALFVGKVMGKKPSAYKSIACKDPSCAYEWAMQIDKVPTKETWLGVRYSPPERDRYKSYFKLTDASIRTLNWHDASSTPRSEFSPSPSDRGQFLMQ